MKPPLRGKGMTGGWQMRQDNRAPKKEGLVTRGFRAGLPHRDQTDTRDHLTWQDALVMVDAEHFAAGMQVPLTTFMTVAWKYGVSGAGRDSTIWKDALDKFRRAAREFLAERNIPPVWVFANERVSYVGGHTHFLMHLPEEKWADNVRDLRQQLMTRRSMPSPFAVRIKGATTTGSTHRRQRLGVIKYLCKSLNPAEIYMQGSHSMGSLVEFLGIDPARCLPLPERLRRIGVSDNIGTQARLDGGFVDRTDISQLAAETLRFGNTGWKRTRKSKC